MDQNPNQAQPEQNQPPSYGPPAGGAPQYPPYGVPAGDPAQYPSYGGPQYPPYGPPMGGPQYPPYPYSGYAQVQPPRKSSKLWLWILLGVIGVALVACIASCGFAFAAFVPSLNSSIQNQEETSTAIATPDNNDNVSSANVQTVPIGQAVTIQNIACTLSSIKHISGDSTASPQAGDEFIVVNIKLTNHSQQALQYDAFDFYIVDSTGRAHLNSNLVPEAYKQQLSGGTLTPGQSIEGKLVFEVVSSDHKQTLDWQSSLNVSPQASNVGAWDLGL